jgi:uncharacterized protein YneF (UPF0154 family)
LVGYTHGEYLTVDWLNILMVNISLLIGWVYSWWISHCWLVEINIQCNMLILMVNISLLIGWAYSWWISHCWLVGINIQCNMLMSSVKV